MSPVSTTLVTVSDLPSLIDASPLLLSSAVTGVMGSVIGKLAALLGEKYQLTRDVERGICFLKDELSTMDAVLQRLADKDDDQIDPVAKDRRNKVRELSYDIGVCLVFNQLNIVFTSWHDIAKLRVGHLGDMDRHPCHSTVVARYLRFYNLF